MPASSKEDCCTYLALREAGRRFLTFCLEAIPLFNLSAKSIDCTSTSSEMTLPVRAELAFALVRFGLESMHLQSISVLARSRPRYDTI